MIETNSILNKEEITRDEVDGESIKYIKRTNQQYAISRNGAVYSFSYLKNGKRIGAIGPQGYPTVCILFDNGRRKVVGIHRLVAIAFIPNPEGKKHVHHKNEDKMDNRVENLSWSTCKEALNSGSHNERLAASIKEYYKKRDTFNKEPIRVAVMDKEENVLEVSPSIQAAADWIKLETGKNAGASAMQMSNILRGKPGFKTVRGFKVRRASEEEYTQWVANKMNSLLREEDVTLSDEQLDKITRIDGIKVTFRRLDPKTGEMNEEVSCVAEKDIKKFKIELK
jgi:hypothetical protein